MSESIAKSNVLSIMQEQPIVAYDKFRTELAELEAINEKTIFQYDTVAGFTAAKSYIARLRRSAGAVEKVRKAEKAESLNYGRLVDKQAKEIESRVRAMIEVHQKPIDEIEAREEQRIAAIRTRIDRIKTMQNADGHTSEQTAKNLKLLGEVKVDESFGEFQVEVTIEIAKAIEAQTIRHEAAKIEEAEKAEAKRVAAEQAAEAQRIRDAAIAKEAAERATKEAEAFARLTAERVKADYEKAIQDAEIENQKAEYARLNAEIARERAEKQAEFERIAAEESAERERVEAKKREREAVEAEQRRVATEAKRIEDEAVAREADKEHRGAINREILAALVEVYNQTPEAHVTKDTVMRAIVDAMAQGKIPHVKISY